MTVNGLAPIVPLVNRVQVFVTGASATFVLAHRLNGVPSPPVAVIEKLPSGIFTNPPGTESGGVVAGAANTAMLPSSASRFVKV